LDNHLLPAWKDKKLGKLRKAHVIELKTALQQQQNNANTIVNVLTVATVVLNHGIELEWLQSNVASQTKNPKRVKRPIRLLNDAEQRALIRAADSNYKMLFLLALRSDLRKGELLGLQWQSVNLDKGTIEVREQYTHGAVSTPKTAAGRRIVPIDPDAAGQLKGWRALARRPRDRFDLVFPSSTGRHQSASNVHHRQWKPG
jgi:integrase